MILSICFLCSGGGPRMDIGRFIGLGGMGLSGTSSFNTSLLRWYGISFVFTD